MSALNAAILAVLFIRVTALAVSHLAEPMPDQNRGMSSPAHNSDSVSLPRFRPGRQSAVTYFHLVLQYSTAS